MNLQITYQNIFTWYKKIIQVCILNLILFSSLLGFNSHALQTCDDYIPNQWTGNRYTVSTINNESSVYDKQTGLSWQQCPAGQSGESCIGTASTHDWQQALQFPLSVNATGGFAGKTDWRLPNIKELQSLVAYNCFNPSINLTVFPNTPVSVFGFVSSSPRGGGYNIYKLNFYYGNISYNFRNFDYYVRLVRTGQ
jgi:hypothetical protein